MEWRDGRLCVYGGWVGGLGGGGGGGGGGRGNAPRGTDQSVSDHGASYFASPLKQIVAKKKMAISTLSTIMTD